MFDGGRPSDTEDLSDEPEDLLRALRIFVFPTANDAFIGDRDELLAFAFLDGDRNVFPLFCEYDVEVSSGFSADS